MDRAQLFSIFRHFCLAVTEVAGVLVWRAHRFTPTFGPLVGMAGKPSSAGMGVPSVFFQHDGFRVVGLNYMWLRASRESFPNR